MLPFSFLSSLRSLPHSLPYLQLPNLGFSFYRTRKDVHRVSFSPLLFSAKRMSALHCKHSSIRATLPSGDGAVSVINFEDFHEKDWSFLDSMESNNTQKIERVIKSGEISETSRVLVSMGSEGFVHRLVESSPSKLLLVVHDSLFVLACIKEQYDNVRCWQGELIHIPEKWSPFDVVFLYFLPALPFKLDEVFGTLAKHCLPGARLVISHPQGREALAQQRKQFPDVVASELPDETNLQKMAKKHSFELSEFVDQSGFYLAVLKYS